MITPTNPNPAMPVQPTPELAPPELAPLFAEPFASAWAATPGDLHQAQATMLRQRLQQRAQASRDAESAMLTRRLRRSPRQALAQGVQAAVLYQAEPGGTRRAGEPHQVRLLQLAPHAELLARALGDTGALQARHREWLVLDGAVRQLADGQAWLGARDYHVNPAGSRTPSWQAGPKGATLFLREADIPAHAGDQPLTVLDAQAGWPDFAPGIRRRVLWQRDGQAALLYHTDPGASVPLHRHGHDEECLMVQGELFLDDVLLQPGDWQLAPVGTRHHLTSTDTGVVIYAHGDLDLQFLAAP